MPHSELGVALQFDDVAQRREAAALGMWTFLATEILFFGVLFAAYIVARNLLPAGFAEGSRHTDIVLGAAETGVLLTSSLVMSVAVRAVQLDRRTLGTVLLAGTALLAVAFLAIHGMEYVDEYHEGLVPRLRFAVTGPLAPQVEMFFFMYYVTTGFHALHVLIGAGAISVAAAGTWKGRYSARRYDVVELIGLYWHLVDIVWVFVFPCYYLVSRS